MRLGACTVVSRRELPAARLLSTSFLRFHDDARFTVLVVDDREGQVVADDRYEILRPSDLGLPHGELEMLALALRERELASALTPWLLRLLLDRDGGPVLAFAPAVRVLAPLDDVGELAARQGLVLVPRAECSPPRDGRQPDEKALRAAGVVAPGFVAVGPAGRAFLEWWRDRYRDPTTAAPSNVLDLAPAFFGAHMLRDPTCHVSWWNLHCRSLAEVGGRYTVDGRPLRSFDFTGYDPGRPQLLCDSPAPRFLPRDHPALAALVEEYHEQLVAARVASERRPYAYGILAAGSPVDDRMRSLYREELARARATNAEAPPNPFVDDTEAFVAWLDEPVFPPLRPTVSRYLARMWREHDDLRQRFPSLAGASAERYLEWVRAVGSRERGVPPCVRPTQASVETMRRELRARAAEPLATGVNLVGYLEAVSGVGEVGRALLAALGSVGADVAPVAARETLSARQISVETVPVVDARYDVNVLCVNAAQMPDVADQLGAEFFAGRRTAGVWFWEVEEFPVPAHGAADVLDEIWVASEFTAQAIGNVVDKPVRTIPVPIRVPDAAQPVPPASLGLPEGRHLFLYTFDFLSVPERKNPRGAVEAFTRAFAPDEGPVLVLKSVNGDERVAALEEVRAAAEGRADVVVIDEYWSAQRQAALLAQCDAYVSLHRSEGYGLTIAEAMALGKPVVATGYSGNLAFMDRDNGYLVDYVKRPIGPGCAPYPPDCQWAEPDLDHAAALLRAVVEHPQEARERGRRAAERVRRSHSVEAAGAALAEAVEHLRRADWRPASWRAFFMRGWRSEPRARNRRRYPYDWLPDGTPVDDTVHRILRHPDRYGAPPDPDQPGKHAAMASWLNEPLAPDRGGAVSRYLLEIWRSRPDLQDLYPDLTGDPAPYLRWALRWGDDEDIPLEFRPSPGAMTWAERVSSGHAAAPPRRRGVASRAARAVYRPLRRLRRGTREPPGKGGGPRHA